MSTLTDHQQRLLRLAATMEAAANLHVEIGRQSDVLHGIPSGAYVPQDAKNLRQDADELRRIAAGQIPEFGDPWRRGIA